MRRREFITLACGAAAWPRAVNGQSQDRMRRIAVLMGVPERDPEGPPRVKAFLRGLHEGGWIEGRNIQLDYRWAGADIDRMPHLAKELLALKPDVILGHNTRPVAALAQETRTLPIVFVAVADPVGSGFVVSMSRPGGNITGFTNHEPSLAGKWLELLKEIAPQLTRVALLFNPETAPLAGSFFSGGFEAAAQALRIQPVALRVGKVADIEPAITALATEPNSGLVVMADTFTAVHRALIITLVAQHRIPAAYPWPYFATGGGLVAYGPDQLDMFRRASSYVDRILRGANPADLPVQAPTKFELVVNSRTAKTLGVTLPFSLLARADEVIE